MVGLLRSSALPLALAPPARCRVGAGHGRLARIQPEMTEEELLRAICAGGGERDRAVRELYDRFAQQFLRYFVHHGASGDEAKDILQDVFIKIVRFASNYVGDAPALHWINVIKKNCLIEFHRKNLRHSSREVVLDEDEWRILGDAGTVTGLGTRTERDVAAHGQSAYESSEIPWLDRETAQRLLIDECVAVGLDKFAQEMPERAFAMTLLMEGLSMAEIGVQIGRSANATKEFVSQCRKKIKPFIAHCSELLAG